MSSAVRFVSILTDYLECAASLFFPPSCTVCRKPGESPVCPRCVALFRNIDGAVCLRCGKPTLRPVEKCRECRNRRMAFKRAVAVYHYEGAVRDAVHAFKYRNAKRLAGFFTESILLKHEDRFREIDFLTFVPMTRRRELQRGYNQARLLAENIGKAVGVRTVPALRRRGSPKPQSGLHLDERRRNVKGTVESIMRVSGRIALVDDVYTTGSTANECAKALIKAGASEVIVVTLARTVKD